MVAGANLAASYRGPDTNSAWTVLTPYPLPPTPCTLHPTHYTLHLKPSTSTLYPRCVVKGVVCRVAASYRGPDTDSAWTVLSLNLNP